MQLYCVYEAAAAFHAFFIIIKKLNGRGRGRARERREHNAQFSFAAQFSFVAQHCQL